MKTLTLEEKRIRIAQACGWLNIQELDDMYPYPAEGIWWQGISPEGERDALIPDYFGDLNAALSAVRASREKLTDSGSWSRFAILLERHHQTAVLEDACDRLDYFELADLLSSLTAADYSEALGLALGLWKEGE